MKSVIQQQLLLASNKKHTLICSFNCSVFCSLGAATLASLVCCVCNTTGQQ